MPLDKRTVTGKRVAANRAAAQKSTGPKTEDGKRRSAFNSFQHGLFSSQDATIRQAMSRAGYDPAAFDDLHQSLIDDWQPEGAQQALLVEDLTRLYWLKNLQQRAHLEWQARQVRHFRIEQKRALNRSGRDVFFSGDVGNTDGWRYAEPGAAKFDGVFQCFDRLEEKINRADWDEKTSTSLFHAIYHYQPNQPGRKMKNLFQQCREEKAEAGGELAAQLRALIEEERESVREEQRLWEEHCELARDLPLDDDDPALQPLSGNWQEAIDHEAQFDRQINAKMRLLIRLKTPPRQKKTESGPASGAEDGGTGRIGLDSGIPVESAAGTGCADLSRKSALPPVTESHAENIKTGVTKPSNLLESIKPRYGVPSPQAQLRPPALGW